ncbi:MULTISPECIES: RNA polymerase factor sigma-54 [Nitrosomonas]|uniref:RNA polymerase sigma-54 factor n=1 Tax=Nitrosomonas europaea (strain ATCC 19718 / CIP 103999 / KCTC 2705 / NBRC 14298) TaxID=228410 RepID=Q82Y27_NITEU|nr:MULTISPECIES: RNA polymerase factor sigma-54 [Nitrosomonas]CAD83973.1 Sigma-54 factor family [Nitrosomonas europaea ATCC 19718]SDW00298.1 RNA polymerase, sigma 54 subunit, RpoN/SigL [Nitrosomonas europaea]SJZ29908.1 RNA polymerase, sigma 54 subunit, RpoN/SigL [Nitrosomonas europaea]HBF24896.1 RNA polymerase sigma-54 factor [Nitrosomonas sp.]
MKPTLQLKLNTGLTLTPQLQQSIRLLQLSTLELNQEITRLVQENPLLELDEGIDQDGFETGGPDISLSPSDSSAATESNGISEIGKNTDIQSDWPDDPLYADQEFFFDTRRRSDEDHDQDFSRLISKPVSLREHLLSQISLGQYCERSKKIAELLVDSLNDDGYLSQDLDELAELLPPELEISTADLESALDYIQQLDPPGVGARNLQECLSLQLKALPGNTPLRDEALKLVNGHLESFAAKNFQLLKKVLDCNETCLQSIYQLITQLNPKPGDDFNTTTARHVIPDVIVTRSDSGWGVRLNSDSVPRVRINSLYAGILKHHRTEATQMLMGQLKEARWLVRNLDQRMDTILRVSQAIVDCQQAFLEQGETAIRPLVMREIAVTLGLHESTISRVTTQKYMRTPHGIFELKYFFGSHIPAERGEAHSAIAIRGLIKRLIQDEDRRKPLNDSQISQMLAQQGIVIARRTVAKYREFMHIPPTNLRKTL